MVYDMTQLETPRDGLILDGPAKGHHTRCNLEFVEIPEDYGIKMEPIMFTATAEEGHKAAMEQFNIIQYQKVWLERGTVYAWILR